MKFITIVVFLALSVAGCCGQQAPNCIACDRSACPSVSEADCPAGVFLDECGCCQVCAGKLNEECGGKFWSSGRCGRDYFCLGSDPKRPINTGKGELGVCICREQKRVCGTNGIVYDSKCILNETSFEERKFGGIRIEVSENRDICRSAPRISLASPSNTQPLVKHAGDQTYMQCEAEGFPTPVITWTKDGGILPGDRDNIAVQTVGGPQHNQATGWLMISPVYEEDAGSYTCRVSNGVGDMVTTTVQLSVTTGQ